MTPFDKQKLLDAVIKSLEENLKILVSSALEAKEFSTNEESKAENKYDTRGLEASYLASGQAQRAQKLQEQIYLLQQTQLKSFGTADPIGIGSLVQLILDDNDQKWLFVLPSGGVEIIEQGVRIQTITIESPIGRQLHQNGVGHDFEINGKAYEVTGHQ